MKDDVIYTRAGIVDMTRRKTKFPRYSGVEKIVARIEE